MIAVKHLYCCKILLYTKCNNNNSHSGASIKDRYRKNINYECGFTHINRQESVRNKILLVSLLFIVLT